MSNGKNREAAEKGCFNNWLHDMTGAEGGGQTSQSPRALAFVAARRVAAYVEQHPELTAGEVCGKMYGVLVVEALAGALRSLLPTRVCSVGVTTGRFSCRLSSMRSSPMAISRPRSARSAA